MLYEEMSMNEPDRLLFDKWLTTHFITNNRTKTISADKYERICGFISGKDHSNAKFRYWVKSKGFQLVKNQELSRDDDCDDDYDYDDDGFTSFISRCYDGKQLFIQHKAKQFTDDKQVNIRRICSRKKYLKSKPMKNSFLYRKVAVVEDFYDIIKKVHVNNYGCHFGQKQTFKMVASIYAFLPREVITHYLTNCEFCKPRIKKYGNSFTRMNTKDEFQLPCENDYIELEPDYLTDENDNQDEKSVLSKEEQTNEFQIKEDNIEQSLSTDSLNTNKIVNQHSKVPSKLPLKKERIKPSGSGRRLSYSTETDEKLLQWVKNLKDNQFNVTREMLQRQALSVIQIECPEFKASSGWVEKFLVRHGITLPGMCRSLHSLQGDAKRNSEASVEKVEVPKEPVIREPPNLSELLNNVSSHSPSTKEDDDENDDDDDDDIDDNETDMKKSQTAEINPERLKAFNMFVRLFVDENLDRLVPISKQPKEKISAIILSCQRQFPEFSERARKRIRTYLKSCRRSSRLKEPMKRSADNMPSATAHIPSAQLAEVNNILSQACYNESNEVAKRARYDDDVTNHDSVQSKQFQDKSNVLQIVQNNSLHVHNQQHERNASRTPPVKLSSSEIAAVRQLVSGYRESAAFLYRSADELENLLKQSEHYYGQQDPQKQT